MTEASVQAMLDLVLPYAGMWHITSVQLTLLTLPPIGFAEGQASSESRFGVNEGDTYCDVRPAPNIKLTLPHLQELQVGGRIFLLHRYHLRRASKVFKAMFLLPAEQSCPEGATQDRPIRLQFTDGIAFANLMWFFYRYPYVW